MSLLLHWKHNEGGAPGLQKGLELGEGCSHYVKLYSAVVLLLQSLLGQWQQRTDQHSLGS